jgi:hypothetical protein
MSKFKIKTRWKGWHSNNGSQKDRMAHVASASDPAKFPHPDFVMQNGRYAGVKIGDLPAEYLTWIATEKGWGWAKEELARREVENATPSQRTALEKKQRRIEAKSQKAMANAEAKRSAAREKLEYMQAGIDVVGDDYQRLRNDFEMAGGDPEGCPFGEDYEGPSLCWQGGKPMIVASE